MCVCFLVRDRGTVCKAWKIIILNMFLTLAQSCLPISSISADDPRMPSIRLKAQGLLDDMLIIWKPTPAAPHRIGIQVQTYSGLSSTWAEKQTSSPLIHVHLPATYPKFVRTHPWQPHSDEGVYWYSLVTATPATGGSTADGFTGSPLEEASQSFAWFSWPGSADLQLPSHTGLAIGCVGMREDG